MQLQHMSQLTVDFPKEAAILLTALWIKVSDYWLVASSEYMEQPQTPFLMARSPSSRTTKRLGHTYSWLTISRMSPGRASPHSQRTTSSLVTTLSCQQTCVKWKQSGSLTRAWDLVSPQCFALPPMCRRFNIFPSGGSDKIKMGNWWDFMLRSF